MHTLGITIHKESARTDLERHTPLFTQQGLLAAQKRSREALTEIGTRILPGMTEVQARAVVELVLSQMGSPRCWHPPVVRIGKNTVLSFFQDRSAIATLGQNDIFFVDIGPNWLLSEFPGVELEGDVGDTFVLSGDEGMKHVAAFARELHGIGCRHWRDNQPPGDELYQWLAQTAAARGYKLILEDDGHRISEFPHKAYFKDGLTTIGFVPSPDLWILEIHVVDEVRGIGAFFEDVLH